MSSIGRGYTLHGSLEHYPERVKAPAVIERLGLRPHPEGGWYRETWRADAPPGVRSAGSAILYLLRAGERSRWHRVTDATEIWMFNAGDPLELRVVAPPGPLVSCVVVPAFEFSSFELAPEGWEPID